MYVVCLRDVGKTGKGGGGGGKKGRLEMCLSCVYKIIML